MKVPKQFVDNRLLLQYDESIVEVSMKRVQNDRGHVVGMLYTHGIEIGGQMRTMLQAPIVADPHAKAEVIF